MIRKWKRDIYILSVRAEKQLSLKTNEKKVESIRELIVYSKFPDNYNEPYKDSYFQLPKGKVSYEKRNYESIKIEVI